MIEIEIIGKFWDIVNLMGINIYGDKNFFLFFVIGIRC